MSTPPKPRLRFFESAANQRHITGQDRYLYHQESPQCRLAVIGTGTMGQEHMRVATLLGRAQIHGIYDRSAHSMAVASEQYATYSKAKLLQYKDIAATCNDPDVDGVIICTPNFTHFDVLRKVMASGKPILLEKPMATTVADAYKIVELAKTYDSPLQIGLQYRYKAQYVEAFQEVFTRKSVGAVQTISVSEYRPPFLDKVEQWNKFNEFSGGTLVEKCCHYFDLINQFAASRPVRVYASGGQAVNFKDLVKDDKPCDIDDHAFVIVDYENGVRANFTLNMFSPDFNEELVVVGEHARLVATERFSFLQEQATQLQVRVERAEPHASRRVDLNYPKLVEQSGHHGATFFEHIAFLDQLEGLAVDAPSVLDGFWSMMVAAAAQQSMRDKQVVNMDEFFAGHKLSPL